MTSLGKSRDSLGGVPATTSTCTLPSRPVSSSSTAVVRNSRSAAKWAGRRIVITDGARTQREAASIALPSGCLPNIAGSRPHSGRGRFTVRLDISYIAEQNVRLRPIFYESRLLPYNVVVLMAVSCIGDDKRDDDVLFFFAFLQRWKLET